MFNRGHARPFLPAPCRRWIAVAAWALALLLSVPTAWAAYVIEGDVVTDTTSQLMWMRSDDGVTRDWKDALAYCEGLEYGGYSDWRLPDIKELYTLVNLGYTAPPIDTSVFSCETGRYISSSPSLPSPYFDYIWAVQFGDGSVEHYYRHSLGYSRCVRAGP